MRAAVAEIWSIEPEDVEHARTLAYAQPALAARDLLHLASCRRRSVTRVKTYDRALDAAFRRR